MNPTKDKAIQDIRDLLKIQGAEAKTSPYMRGLANGLELALSCLTGNTPMFYGKPDEGYTDEKFDGMEGVQFTSRYDVAGEDN